MELKNNALFKETCFIGGKWIESDSGEKIKVDNPANGEIIGEVNSYHNFCISKCPKNYSIIAMSDDKSIEAMKHRRLPWEGWMWHPEREIEFSPQDIERFRVLFG